MGRTRLRAACPEDANILAVLYDMSSDGMPSKFWQSLAAPGQSIWDLAASRARREEGDFSYRRAWVLEDGGEAVAGFFGGALSDDPVEIDPDGDLTFAPFQELQNLACGSWHLDAMAVLPDHRGRGLGQEMLKAVSSLARDNGRAEISLVVMSHNQGARRLYHRSGFAERSRRLFTAKGWPYTGSEAILLSRPSLD